MPNHITNEIKVLGGTNKERLAFIRSITNKHGLIDFNNITKMPKSMNIDESTDVENMASAIAGKPMADFWIDEIKTKKEIISDLRSRGMPDSYIKQVKQHALMRIENKQRYGFYSWHDWSREKWGTKWNAYSVQMPVEMPKRRIKWGHKYRHTHVRAYSKRVFKKHLARYAVSGAPIVIRFETAWASPNPVILDMSRRFPHLTFDISYADEDMGSNCGKYIIRAGSIASSYVAPSYRDQSGEERRKWRKFAFQLRYPGKTPQKHGMNDQYEYVDDDE
ncbi:hypothetical protein ACIPUP_00955 [Pectobacterium actinidiae]|uniref:YubB ferredoxin-like domain-containing protein n=1 Tax=Pectobacterium actinidiae TaxID=1507808 RepID=A0ABW8G4Y3_9GAMM